MTDKLFKQLLFFVILATAGIVINFMPFPLHFRVDFLFGGICALIAVYVLPPLPGIITAAIIALPTFTLWHHFFGIIMYTLEAVAVTILLRKTRLHMLTCATITWFFLLPPIIYLNMQLSGMFFPAAIRLFLIKYTLNGVFNAAIAAAIIFIFKLKPTEEKHAEMEITASEAAINAFIIVTIIPLLIFTLLDSRIISGTVFTQLQNRHDSLKKILSLEVNNWHKEQLKTLGQIADLAGQTNNFEHLDNLLENFIKNQSEFSRFHFSDLEGKSLCCSPAHDDHDFCFATFNGKLQAFHHSVIDTEKSLFSGVQTDQHLASTPVIIIAQPTFAAGKIKGVVTGVLAVSSLEKRLQPLIDQNITVKIIDENSKIVYSSNSGKIGQPYESKLHLANSIHNGKLTIIPPEEQMVTSSRYRHSTLIFDNRLNTPANWNMVIEEPLKKYVDTLFDLSFTQFLNISLLIFIMVIMSGFIRRFFSTPLRELSDYTNEIAKTGFCGSSLPTPTSKVYEINRLIENFSAAMDKISESQNHEKQKNQELQNLNDELKKRMKELRETKLIADQAERSFANLVKNSPFSILLTDSYGNIEYINDEFKQNIGFDISSRPPLAHLFTHLEPSGPIAFPVERLLTRLKKVSADDRYVDTGELTMLRDGTKKVFNCVATGSSKRYILMFADVTDAALAAEERSRLTEQIQAAQKFESLGTLAGGIAHDFNNILMSIMGYAELSLSELSPSGQLHSNLSMIHTAARRAADLTRQMLDFTGKNVFTLSPINISDLVKEMTTLLSVAISKKINISYNLKENAVALANGAQMRQIVLNLVMNAAEAIGENEGQINITTGVTHKNGDFIKAAMNNDFSTDISDYIYIEIADNGCGMDAVTVKKIFDPFFSTKFTGRGLGLSAALGIIKSHQGAIDVESRPGEGSRFRVFLPIADTKHTDAENDDEEPAKIELSGKILLADDEETIRNITSMMLESLDVEVICAEDGLAAVEAFAQNRKQIEVIILDVVMPKLNGEEACRKIREMDPQIPIIIASGYSFEETTARFKTTEFNGFLQKPFKLKELIEQINTAAQSRCAEAVTE